MMNDSEDIDAIFKELTDDLDTAEPYRPLCVADLTNLELISLFRRIKNTLNEAGELLHPTSDATKDMQSNYYGCLIEMKKRGL